MPGRGSVSTSPSECSQQLVGARIDGYGLCKGGVRCPRMCVHIGVGHALHVPIWAHAGMAFVRPSVSAVESSRRSVAHHLETKRRASGEAGQGPLLHGPLWLAS